MLFIKVTSPKGGQAYLTKALAEALNKGLRVGWLISGGSNAALASDIRRSLPSNKLGYLKIALVDERYGRLGHSDSSFTKLQAAGFDFSGVDFRPIITSDDLNFQQTLSNYEHQIQDIFEGTDIVFGQFGIGSDGHTAGILPHSPAAVSGEQLVIGYKGADFERITISFKAISLINEAYVFAFGEDKLRALSLLGSRDIALDDQPAQIFRQSGGKSFIINDMIGDKP